jgi:hypothetical protein
VTDTDRALADAITTLLDRRREGATICPSEAARRVEPADWRDIVPDARRVAARLVADGRIEMFVSVAATCGPQRSGAAGTEASS